MRPTMRQAKAMPLYAHKCKAMNHLRKSPPKAFYRLQSAIWEYAQKKSLSIRFRECHTRICVILMEPVFESGRVMRQTMTLQRQRI